MSRRRSEDFLLAGKPTDILIKIADSYQPIEAHLVVLLPCSKLVRDLPRTSSGAGKTSWDLSQLVLEGQSSPVTSAVVRQWLDLVYSRVDVARQVPTFTSLSAAARSLLLFADAVGTSTAVMRALCEPLTSQPGLKLPVVVAGTVGGDVAGGAAGGGGAAPLLELELELRDKLYYLLETGDLRSLDVPYSGSNQAVVEAGRLAPYKAALPGAVAAALEGWLYLAGRLRLVPLVRLLLDFFQVHLLPNARASPIFLGATPQVFTRRVLECMPQEVMWEGFVSDRLWAPQLGQADVPAGKGLSLTMRSPHAATWFGLGPNMQLTSDVTSGPNEVNLSGNENVLRVSVGGLTPAQHQAAVREVMQQLQDVDVSA
ncbi:hypothetical protein HYH02_012718 [Chlamydomonas schloesseri]|uniref:Uncharacterized protein n=1 Tax=Chlamydomonas schloesseri TaxID=2026947 RepID=A0A835T7R3_9CHLO|nr:hypothetical protein HYH02_012718 [Chlamydomonas schloesseri]|eukprot:KAG2433175.1 hypothetical protein HYH02_012718 [Chlamydomonas schloesseri]